MTIGICRFELYLPTCQSLKDKRRLLKSLIARIQNKFNVSVSELEENDLRQKALVGVAVISNASTHANQMLSKIVEMIDRETEIVMMDYTLELL
ncbi:MAG: hypothetical protein ACI8V2_000615 [Candidatus Latescibacterota bacterium]|jgi:uncharacterized protein